MTKNLEFKSNTIIDIAYDSAKIGEGITYSTEGVQRSSVNWNLFMETREWGLKNLLPSAPNQTIEVEIDVEEGDLEPSVATLEIEVTDIQCEDIGGIDDTGLEVLVVKITEIRKLSENKYIAKATGLASF